MGTTAPGNDGLECLRGLEQRTGEVQASPTSNTVLDRLKALLTGIVLAAGTAVMGKVRMVTATGSEVTDDVSDAVNVINEPMFGEPTLEHANNGWASWGRGGVSPLDQKGPNSWLANLYGGAQTGDDWARVVIPVKEMSLPDVASALWTYYMTNAESMGVNIVLWIHDPNALQKRAEITQLANVAGLGKAAGWNAHALNLSTVQFFFYGENTAGTDLTAGTLYALTSFQADVLFKDWTVYRITIEYGWEASGTFEDAWVADIKLNGKVIVLKPDSGGSGRYMQRIFTGAAAIAATLAPKTPFDKLNMLLHLNAAATQENLTAGVDAGRGTVYDANLLTVAMGTNAITDLQQEFPGPFAPDDEIDVAWANTDTKTYGLTLSCRTVPT